MITDGWFKNVIYEKQMPGCILVVISHGNEKEWKWFAYSKNVALSHLEMLKDPYKQMRDILYAGQKSFVSHKQAMKAAVDWYMGEDE